MMISFDIRRSALAAALVLAAVPGAAIAASDLDGRTVLRDVQDELPALGLLTGEGTRCTAFVTGSDSVVATAAHCVLGPDGKPRQETFGFQPGYANARSTDTFRVRVISHGDIKLTPDGSVTQDTVGGDWALLMTDRPTTIRPLPLAVGLSAKMMLDQPLAAVGYSTNVDHGRFATMDSDCKVLAVPDMRLEHDCRGGAGVAGGPIFSLNSDGTRDKVVGLNVQGATSRVSERLVIRQLRLLGPAHPMPQADYGGRAVFVGAFQNAVKLVSTVGVAQVP